MELLLMLMEGDQAENQEKCGILIFYVLSAAAVAFGILVTNHGKQEGYDSHRR